MDARTLERKQQLEMDIELGRGHLCEMIAELEAELREENQRANRAVERLNKTRQKVEAAIAHCKQNAFDAREALHTTITELQEKEIHEGQAHEEATGEIMQRTDTMRRAYAMYDAIRSVPIWMDYQNPTMLPGDEDEECRHESFDAEDDTCNGCGYSRAELGL